MWKKRKTVKEAAAGPQQDVAGLGHGVERNAGGIMATPSAAGGDFKLVEAGKELPFDHRSYAGYYGDGVTRGEAGWLDEGRGQ